MWKIYLWDTLIAESWWGWGGWIKTWYIDLLVVWGWGAGAPWNYWAWGWGAWWFVECICYPVNNTRTEYSVTVWWRGVGCIYGYNQWCDWWRSFFNHVIAYWWWGWGVCTSCWRSWASWWWGGWYYWNYAGWGAIYWNQWRAWWSGSCVSWGIARWWWGWGAGGAWCAWNTWYWQWWAWKCSSISWATCWYSWWWGWYSSNWCKWAWWCWWWGWCQYGNQNAVYYWWGGWGYGWAWYCWVVILRYHTDWSDWILPSSVWWTKYTCWDYTIHCFTSNDTRLPTFA